MGVKLLGAHWFAEVEENGIQDLMVSSVNENKSTNYWLNVFQKRTAAREVKQRLKVPALDKTLCEEEFCPRCHKYVTA